MPSRFGKLAAVFLVAVTSYTSASAEQCKSLWIERNQIFHDAGYCFGSDLGKEYFGNAGCSTKSPVFSPSQQQKIRTLKERGNQLGCASQRKSWTVSSLRKPSGGTTVLLSECQTMWIERNQYFKDARYCFGSDLAKGYFGNAGCTTKSPSFSSSISARIKELKSREDRMGCSAERSSWTLAALNGSNSTPRVEPQRSSEPNGGGLAGALLRGMVSVLDGSRLSSSSNRDRSKDVCYQLPSGSDAQIACLGDHVMAIRDDRARNIMLGNCLVLGSSDFSSELSYVCQNGTSACSILRNGEAAYHCGQCGATRRWLAVYSLGHTIQCFK